MHPFIPFVTEKLYLEITDEPSIMISDWPKAENVDSNAIEYFKEIQDAIVKVRNLRAENQVAPSKPIKAYIIVTNESDLDLFNHQKAYFEKFLNTSELRIDTKLNTEEETILLLGSKLIIHIIKSDLIDPKKELETLLKQKETLEAEIKRSESLLKNEKFMSKAPEDKIKIENDKYQDYLNQYEVLKEKLKSYV